MTSGKQARSDRADRAAKIAAVTPKQSRARLFLGVGLAILFLVGIGAGVWFGVRSSGSTEGRAPAGATGESGGIVVTAADKLREGAPTVDVYEDFQCPACKSRHEMLGPTLTELSDTGQIKLVYHLKNFLEKQMTGLGRTSSTAAANAAACAADAGKFLPYHSALYALQPATEGQGYSPETINQAAVTAGITGEALTQWQQCVKDGTYNGYVERVDAASAEDKVNSTPTYRSNGTTIDFQAMNIDTIDKFKAALLTGGTSTTMPSGAATPAGTATTTAR